MDSCRFCAHNAGAIGDTYRAKSPSRIVSEMETQAERYANSRFFFLDDVSRPKDTLAFAAAIKASAQRYDFRTCVLPLLHGAS